MEEKIKGTLDIICDCIQKGAEQIREKENITREDLMDLHRMVTTLERIRKPIQHNQDMDDLIIIGEVGE